MKKYVTQINVNSSWGEDVTHNTKKEALRDYNKLTKDFAARIIERNDKVIKESK